MIEFEIERRLKDHRLPGEPIEDAVARLVFEHRALRNRLDNALLRISVVEVERDGIKDLMEEYRDRLGKEGVGYSP